MASSASTTSATGTPKRPQPAQLTNLARKYGHPYKKIKDLSHRILKHTGKSGITPLSPFFPQNMQNKTPRSRKQKYQFFYYQQHRYQGFTAAELHGMEALSSLDVIGTCSNLTNSIHPMFGKDKWDTDTGLPRHLPFIPLFTGHDGFWQVSNPIVWKILEPALRLASCLLVNSSVWPWWDAMFNGSYNKIKPHRVPPSYSDMKLLSFHARSAHILASPAAFCQLKSNILSIHHDIRFGFFSGYTNPLTHLPRKEDQYIFGSTNQVPYEECTKVWIAVEILQPLLRADLNASERMSNLFRVASTIIHECAHAVWERLSIKHEQIAPAEPYFEDEPIAEIGWSLEDKLWKGYGIDIIGPEMSQGGPGLPNMGIYHSKWFTEAHDGYRSDVPTLDHHAQLSDEQARSDKFYWLEHWPVPASWITKLFQSFTWDTLVRQFGPLATEMGPLTLGTRRMTWEAQSYHSTTEQVNYDTSDKVVNGGMTNSERAKTFFENMRRSQARVIMMRVLRDRGMGRGILHPDFQRIGGLDDWDSRSDSEDEDEMKTPSCRRWSEIKKFLGETRGPGDLAWDSMSFEIPEWTLFRYIQRRGGLVITPAEWHDFLVFADYKKELFQYRSNPWSGAVRRIEAGWPTTPCPFPPSSGYAPKPSAISTFEKLMHMEPFLYDFYYMFREFRDVDYGDILKFVNIFVRAENRLTRGDIFDVVDYWGRQGKYVTWGPYCIARMTVDIPQRIKDQIDPPPPQETESRRSQMTQIHAATPTKTQEEFDLEQFEQEAEGSDLNITLSDLDMSSNPSEEYNINGSGIGL